MRIKIINKSDNPLPKYETCESSGLDLMSNVEDVIQPKDWRLIKTGIALQIPRGFEGQVRSRSGLAYKKGIFVLNSPGTIDSDYRGEVGVILMNMSEEPFFIHKGDRIAQLVICPIAYAHLKEAYELEPSIRGDGGFGSTGVSSAREELEKS